MPTLAAVGLCAPVPASLPHPVCLRMSAMLGPETFRRKRITVSSGAGMLWRRNLCPRARYRDRILYIAWRNPNRVRENFADRTVRITGTVSR